MTVASAPDIGAVPDPLAGLRGYRLPDPVAWWPPAPGWWVLALLLVAAAGILGWWLLRRRRCTAAARQAQRELARLRRGPVQDAAALARGLSKLLRRYALARFARGEVAALTGEAWLAFLDVHGGEGRFRSGAGRQLVEAPYRPAGDGSVDQLFDLVEDWIRRNREGCR